MTSPAASDSTLENELKLKKRILFVCTRFGTGGAEMNAYFLASELKKRGHECHVAYLVESSSLDISDKEIYSILHKGITKNPIKYLTSSFKLLRFIAIFKPDAIIGFHPFANIISSLGSLLSANTSFIGTQRNPSNSQKKSTQFVEMLLGSTPLYKSNIAVSNAVLNSYTKYPASYRRKMSVIYNGIKKPAASDHHCKIEARAALGLPPKAKIIGTIGRLSYQKNQEFLINLIAELDDIILVLAGTGENEPMLRKMVKEGSLSERVYFTGNLAGDYTNMFYSAIDVFLLPSRYEGFGRTLIEAMHFGLPVLANDLEVTREIIGDAGTLKKLDTNLWKEELSNILHAHSSEKISSDSKARASKFSPENMVTQYEKNIIHASQNQYKNAKK